MSAIEESITVSIAAARAVEKLSSPTKGESETKPTSRFGLDYDEAVIRFNKVYDERETDKDEEILDLKNLMPVDTVRGLKRQLRLAEVVNDDYSVRCYVKDIQIKKLKTEYNLITSEGYKQYAEKEKVRLEETVRTEKEKNASLAGELSQLQKECDKMAIPECPACFLNYTHDGETIPRFLNCGHTYCTECLLDKWKDGEIYCEEDRIKTKTSDVTTLPKNWAIFPND